MIKKIKDYFNAERKELKEWEDTVDEILIIQEGYSDLKDEELRNKTVEFAKRLRDGETADDLLVEAFAVVREAAKRTLGMEHYPVQILGAIVLHKGQLAEMKTGEGKTLTATMPAYLNALTGNPVHIYTANDYLAYRDFNWMKPIYDLLGVRSGLIITQLDLNQRKNSYKGNIIYGTATEFGNDYLVSNMAMNYNDILNTKYSYAIVDEIDTILIDAARVPIIITERRVSENRDYLEYPAIISQLEVEKHFKLELDARQANLTEEGIEKIEEILGIENLYSNEHILKVHRIKLALGAKFFLSKDVDYIVDEGKIIVIEGTTGRILKDRKFGDGIQQSIEAKEGVSLSPENMTKGSITFQNLMLQYSKISGMSGTIKTVEPELLETYSVRVYEIPTHKDSNREDWGDSIYKTKEAKYKAILAEVEEVHETERPILIGTESVEESQLILDLVTENGLAAEMLNAKNHQHEAEIISNAGERNAITIITNMAGRGTDIVLEDGVNEIGGLHVIATAKHENRRLDDQLKGRAGRQGDKGTTHTFCSLEDELFIRFGGDKARLVFNKVKLVEDKPIIHPMATKLIEQMQIQSEVVAEGQRSFIKKYDDIFNEQRKVLYESRFALISSPQTHVKQQILELIEEVFYTNVELSQDEENVIIHYKAAGMINRFLPEDKEIKEEDITSYTEVKDLAEYCFNHAKAIYEEKESAVGLELLADALRGIMISISDKNWYEHIDTMEHLRQGISVRGKMGNPFLDFAIESHDLFDDMIFSIKEMTAMYVLNIQIMTKEDN